MDNHKIYYKVGNDDSSQARIVWIQVNLMQACDSIGLQMHKLASFLGFYVITCSRAPMNVHKSSEFNAYCESN